MKVRSGFVSNSSSEAFICNSDHSPEETKDILKKMLSFYNEMFDRKVKFEEAFETPRFVEQEDIDFFKDWGYTLDEDNFSDVIILSESDNTIPYALFDFISFKFNALRIHLG